MRPRDKKWKTAKIPKGNSAHWESGNERKLWEAAYNWPMSNQRWKSSLFDLTKTLRFEFNSLQIKYKEIKFQIDALWKGTRVHQTHLFRRRNAAFCWSSSSSLGDDRAYENCCKGMAKQRRNSKCALYERILMRPNVKVRKMSACSVRATNGWKDKRKKSVARLHFGEHAIRRHFFGRSTQCCVILFCFLVFFHFDGKLIASFLSFVFALGVHKAIKIRCASVCVWLAGTYTTKSSGRRFAVVDYNWLNHKSKSAQAFVCKKKRKWREVALRHPSDKFEILRKRLFRAIPQKDHWVGAIGIGLTPVCASPFFCAYLADVLNIIKILWKSVVGVILSCLRFSFFTVVCNIVLKAPKKSAIWLNASCLRSVLSFADERIFD